MYDYDAVIAGIESRIRSLDRRKRQRYNSVHVEVPPNDSIDNVVSVVMPIVMSRVEDRLTTFKKNLIHRENQSIVKEIRAPRCWRDQSSDGYIAWNDRSHSGDSKPRQGIGIFNESSIEKRNNQFEYRTSEAIRKLSDTVVGWESKGCNAIGYQRNQAAD